MAALTLAAAGVLGFVFWSSHNIDQRSLERQTGMVATALESIRLKVGHDQTAVTVWDDAVLRTTTQFDAAWVHSNLGVFMHDFFGHDRTLVVSGEGVPIYAMIKGEAATRGAIAPLATQLAPLLGRVRNLTNPETDVPTIADFAVVEGKPAVVAATPIVSDTGALPQAPGTEPLMASVLFLNADVANAFASEYLFENARFSFTEPLDKSRAVYPILNRAGRFIAFFEWDRDRPGLLLMRQAGPALAAAVVITAMALYWLIARLRRSSAALEAGRRHAEHQAMHDRLTGLPNRASFDAHLAGVLAHAQRERDLWLLMLDLDRFKQVNDTLGHQAGDDLIRAVGRRIRLVTGEGMFIARLGGDEFAIVAEAGSGGLDVHELSGRLIEAIAQPFYLNTFKAHVGVSIGIVGSSAASGEPSEIVRKADIALYEAKANGRNRAVVYEEHMNEFLQLQHTVEAELREALTRSDQLTVAFQPLVDAKSRRVVGAEALARWHHPKFGQISPARFIPIAENTGLIEALGELVLRRACEIGAQTPGRTIAVNISPTQLRNPRFAAQVFDILHETGMRAIDLELEITESILLDDEHISAQNLRTFRTAGVHIALDDFGTGYSSLSYLKRYPVDRIKIDRSFVSQLTDGHVSVAITQAIVTLAHAMNIEVTAEGVETDGQSDILCRLGCNTLQGFLFSGPVAPERIVEVFADPANAPLRRFRAA